MVFHELRLYHSATVSDFVSWIFILSLLAKEMGGLAQLKVKDLPVSKTTMVLFVFLLWTLVSPFIFGERDSYFNIVFFGNNVLRLGIFCIGFVVIPFYLNRTGVQQRILQHMCYILAGVCILAIIQFILVFVLHIPVDFGAYVGNSAGNSSGEALRRIGSVFSEPAHLGIFIGIFASPIMIARKHGIKIRYDKVSIYLSLIALALTLSLSAYTFLAVLLYASMRNVTRQYKVGFLITLCCLGVIAILVLVGTRMVSKESRFSDLIITRIDRIVQQEDASANTRLWGSWEYALDGLNQSRLAGIGLGQSASYHAKHAGRLAYYWGMSGINNVLALVLRQTGIIGFGLFVVFTYAALKRERLLLTVFILYCFACGYFNTAVFWLFLYISTMLISCKHESIALNCKPEYPSDSRRGRRQIDHYVQQLSHFQLRKHNRSGLTIRER